MEKQNLPEFWLRGPVEGVPPLLQPAAHAMLQAMDEITGLMNNFPDELLWEKPAGNASVAFHLQHIVGVLDRLFTYAEGKGLSEEQLAYLKLEGVINTSLTTDELLGRFRSGIATAIEKLKETDEQNLLKPRPVGRARLPSTVLGLMFHAAEHTMRHTGQLLVTVRILKETGEE